jgi:acyl-coenzyme A synthetase/AMP-(fatty) acid ligase
MGWVVQDPRQVAGMILCNTGIAVPEGRRAPGIIRLAAWAPILDAVCRGTPTFVEGTLRLSGRRITRTDRQAFRAPYRTAPMRAAIADFVDDVPLSAGHPSERSIAEVADRLRTVHAPVLLAWGAKDPVFDDDFAADLAARFPSATLQRFGGAGHLVMAEADVAGVAETWLDDLFAGRLAPAPPADAEMPEGGDGHGSFRDDRSDEQGVASVWSALDARRTDTADAFVDMAGGDAISFAELHRRIECVAAALAARGLRAGDRVAMMTPPGVDLVAAVYGVWRAGGVTVIADRGLGMSGLGRAIRSARPEWVIGPLTARAAASALRWAPGALHVDVGELAARSDAGAPPRAPGPDDPAAVLFTSGATGPAKGVRYTHRQLVAQRDALARTYGVGPTDRLVAAFAPFALYGPALAIPTALPACDVTKPATLTAEALGAACERIDATLAFASPSALANVVATASPDRSFPSPRLILSAGAPVPSETLEAVAQLAPSVSLHTPYGMTEVLPVCDIDLAGILAAEADDPRGGVCVGPPVEGAEVRVVPLGFDAATVPDPVPDGVTGEILVRAPWVSAGYLDLWAIERAARPGAGDWHRSGDVGHLDTAGRLWVEGRSVHVVDAVDGPITPVPVERAVDRALGVTRSAAVGVGPAGRQQLVVVLERPADPAGPVATATADAVRGAVDHPIAAVLSSTALPVDIRHNAKIDRTAVARWADDLLAGRRTRP